MSSSVCVCRGCLATASECKLYDMRQHGLLTVYRQILQHTNSPVGEIDLHPYMCSYCTALLIKCSAFRDKCIRVMDLLKHVSLSNVEVTANCINTIDRVSNKLIIPLNIDRNVQVIDTHTYIHAENVIKKEIEFTEKPLIKETDSDQEILSGVVNNEVTNVAHLKADTNNIKVEIELIEESFIKKELCSDIDSDDVLDDISKQEKEDEEKKKNIHNVSSDEYTDMKDTSNEIQTDSDEEDAVDSNNEKPNEQEKKKVIKRQREYKPKMDDETFSKQYNVDIITLTKEEQKADLEARKDSQLYEKSPYKCETCFTGWNSQGTFNNHLRKHDEKSGQYCCDICGYRFKCRLRCRAHCLNHKFKLVCRVCQFVSKSKNMARCHHKKHLGHTFKCELCGETHPSRTAHLRHLRVEHPTEGKTCACAQCGEVFIGARGLQMHRVRTDGNCHPVSGGGAEDASKSCAESVGEHECVACGLKFLSAASLGVHRQRVHEKMKPANLYRNPKNKYTDTSKRTWHVCEVCGKRYHQPILLRYHLMMHNGVFPFQCTLCPKGFSSKNLLLLHSRMHTGEKPYRCEECGHAFSRKSNYNKHKVVHTGERNYKCDICGKYFTQGDTVKTHIRAVHMKVPAKPRVRVRPSRGTRARRQRAIAEPEHIGDKNETHSAVKEEKKETAKHKLRRDGVQRKRLRSER